MAGPFELICTCAALSSQLTVSGHVLDLDSGLVRTIVPATALHGVG